MKRGLVRLFAALLLVGLVRAESFSVTLDSEEEIEARRTAALLVAWIRQVSSATEVTLFEGLPHPGWEREQFKQEVAKGAYFAAGGEHLYREPVQLDPARAYLLGRVFESRASFGELGLLKLCGGFHADWAVRWTLPPGDTGAPRFVWALLCFGCHDYHLLDEEGLCILADIPDAAFAKISEQLPRSRRPGSVSMHAAEALSPAPPSAPLQLSLTNAPGIERPRVPLPSLIVRNEFVPSIARQESRSVRGFSKRTIGR